MPETELSLTAGVRSRTYGEIDSKWPRRIASRLSGLTLVATGFLTDTVLAQSSTGDAALLPAPTGPFANSFEIMNFALVIGAVSAAMISRICRSIGH